MEHQTRTLPPEELIPQLLELLNEVESVPLVITGSSMTPFLGDRRDTVYLSKITRPLKKGDMVLYRRSSGQFVLHRICRVRGETYDLVGDAQTRIESGLRRDQMLAIVRTVLRKGERLERGCFWWDFFEKVWLNIIPFRPLICKIYGIFFG